MIDIRVTLFNSIAGPKAIGLPPVILRVAEDHEGRTVTIRDFLAELHRAADPLEPLLGTLRIFPPGPQEEFDDDPPFGAIIYSDRNGRAWIIIYFRLPIILVPSFRR